MSILDNSKSLPPTWFMPVFVRPAHSKPIWVNERYESKLRATASILSPNSDPNDFLFNLGIITTPPSKTFYNKDEWDNFFKDALILKTEKFFSPYVDGIGAGRCAILGEVQFKGIGRNFGATRLDWLHSWGGMGIVEGLTELLMERKLQMEFPDALVEHYGLFKFDELDQAFLIRSSDFIRCIQCPPGLMPQDKKVFIDYIECKIGNSNRHQWHEQIIRRFIKMMKKGFFHHSPNPENITIDGKLLDHHSLEWIKTDKSPFSIQIKKNNKKNPDESFETLLSQPNPPIFTSLDCIIQMAQSTGWALSNLNINCISPNEVREELIAQFTNWSDFLPLPEDREKILPKLIIEKIKSNEIYAQNLPLTSNAYAFSNGSFQNQRVSYALWQMLKLNITDNDKNNQPTTYFTINLLREIASDTSIHIFQHDFLN